jgi:predicted amidophosphoribosyltransferase
MVLIDYIYPKQCIFCSRIGNTLCLECKSKFLRTLPTCYLCSKLSKDFLPHTHCKEGRSTYASHCYTGWYLTETIESKLSMFKENGICGLYKELVCDIIKFRKLESILQHSIIYPLKTTSSRDTHLNNYLAKTLSEEYRGGIKNKIIYVGEKLSKSKNKIGSGENYNYLILFNYLQKEKTHPL